MDFAAQLQTARERLMTAYVAACENPKPNYSVDGQSVSYGDYLRMLSEALTATNELLQQFQPFEQRSVIL